MNQLIRKKSGILKLLVYRYHGQEINRLIVHVLFLVEEEKKKSEMLPAALITSNHKGRRLLFMIGRNVNISSTNSNLKY